ncbi:MAG TPA: flagellar hook capping FlgD N-terminal domain-containing protein [Geminicoccaceae bacterium]|nr:flagellar hook capping FlgD N-terminal domain-containing protein [Geminicoccaceae bacterium]
MISASNASGNAGGAAAANGASGQRPSLAASFDHFLRLLTTQLENQDPLSPLDAQQFTSQLVQFTAVEQAIKTNDGLGQLVGLIRAQEIGGAAGYLGAEVEARGGAVRLGPSGGAGAAYRLLEGAARVTVTVTDAGGRVVHTAAGETAAGTHGFTWDGRDAKGGRAPEGPYRIEVTAVDAKGAAVAADTTVRGVVDGVEIGAGGVALSVNGAVVPLGAVTAIRRPTP